jgi:Cu/Ag efflux protein CusF
MFTSYEKGKEIAMKNFLLAVAALFTAATLTTFSVAPQFATADEYSEGGAQSWSDKKAEEMPMGAHSMGGTIVSVDHKTGWLKLKTDMGEMTLHYPPQAIKELKKGDKITANLSYTKEEGKKDEGMMMKMK